MPAKFCTTCGSALIERPSHTGTEIRQHCPDCDTTIYDNPSVVVATLPILLGDGERPVGHFRERTGAFRGVYDRTLLGPRRDAF